MLAVLAVACGDPELPFETFEELEKGAFARSLSVSGAFTFGQASSSSYDISVEFYSEDQGQNVASYDWTVEYSGVAGDIAATSMISIPSSSFTTNPDTGLPMASFSFAMTDALAAVGLTESEITGGDRFRFRATLTLNDGRSWNAGNTGPNLFSSAPFSALFLLDANVVCVSDLGGTLNYSSTNMEYGGGGGTSQGPCVGTITGSFDLDDEGDGNYLMPDLSFGMFEYCWSDAPANNGTAGLLDVCGEITPAGTDQYADPGYAWTNLSGAGSPSITFDWINEWGDRGTVTLTRADNSNWPSETRTSDQ